MPWNDAGDRWSLEKGKNVAVTIEDNRVTMEGKILWDSLKNPQGDKFGIPKEGMVLPFVCQFYDVDAYNPDGTPNYNNVEGFKLLCPSENGPSVPHNWSVDLNVAGTYDPTVTAVKKLPEANIPTKYELSNYPNPFNPSTNIKFSLPEAGHVTLKVYNILGQVVSTLVNDNMKAGTYETIFDANGLSSGTYLYVVNVGNHNITGKMLLMK
jgi:hypothetical protein